MSDWLEEVGTDGTAMEEIKKVVSHWRELKFKLDEATSVMEQAKKVYDEYVKTVASTFRTNGMEQLRLEDGMELEVVAAVRCSITKEGKENVAEWLRAKGADNLVKSQLIVMPSAKAQLDKLGIAYDEDVAMNTNSVKAWVKGEMEMQNITLEDLPKGLSWFMYDDIKVR